jgi:hypothetical protein
MITENNYIEKVGYLLDNSSMFIDSIETIIKAQKFIKKNFSKVKEFKYFILSVINEIKKANRTNNTILEASEEFACLYKQDMVKNFGALQHQAQIVKDEYYKLITNAATGMSHKYQLFGGKIDAASKILKGYPVEPNVQNKKKLDELKLYCSDRIIKEPVLGYSISCNNCGYSLSDILNYTELAPNKENDLLILQSNFIKEMPKQEPETVDVKGQPPVVKPPRKVRLQVTNKVMTVREYKSILTSQLTSLATANPDEKIELDIEV